jgi:hypothetical protein
MSPFQLIAGSSSADLKVRLSRASLKARTTLVVALLGALSVNGAGPSITDRLVFVSRQIPPRGSIYWDVPGDMPGVGPHSRFRVAAPARLLVREVDGSIRVLIDGNNPESSLNLIDVNAPDVSYDGARIVFAGLPAATYNRGPVSNPGAWRIYTISADGGELRQVTRSDQQLDLSQFGGASGGLENYDDTDPAWLPDGRIVFSSTRWPSYAQYSGVRTTNLYVVNADGTDLHRITAERNGADRPQIDPVTGKIVYARWWRNHRFALNDMTIVADPAGGFVQKDGLSAKRDVEMDGSPTYADYLWRNVWNAATINPDGTELKAWGGSFLQTGDGNLGHMYGGGFSASGDLFANFYPMFNMTEASGFGGIRRYSRGPEPFTPIIGITQLSQTYVHPSNPTSYGIYPGFYASDATALSDGSLVISWAPTVDQDYGLVQINPDGSGLTAVYDNKGTSELRARVLRPRPRPPVLSDTVTQAASLLPPPGNGPYDADGTFTFNALNVYANAPVDTDIVSAPPVGSAETIRFFIDHQRTSPGSYPNLDWPILLAEERVNADGSIRTTAPANVPLFEQLRSAARAVPVTRGPNGNFGAGHVAGMNFGPTGATATCVGCHIGHTMIPVPANPADAAWTNLAPGARITVSSSRTDDASRWLNDRRVKKAQPGQVWSSSPALPGRGQWIQLEFPVPIRVRTVRLYSPASGGDAQSSLEISESVVRLLDDGHGERVDRRTGTLSPAGTDVGFDDIVTRVVRVEFTQLKGRFYGASVAALNEIEVIARGEPHP